MKKLLITVFSVLMLMLPVFSVPAEAASTFTLKKDQDVTVRAEANDFAWCVFTPDKSGWYKIYSSGEDDTHGYLYVGKTTLLAENDDMEDDSSFNFGINAYLVKGTKYYVKVEEFHGYPFECTVTVTDGKAEYAAAVLPVVTVEYGKTAKLQVVGTCTSDPSTTYTWYKDNYNFDTMRHTDQKLSCTSSTLTLKNCKKYGEYVCVINEEDGPRYVSFILFIKNNYSAELKTKINENLIFVHEDKLKLEVTPHGNDLSDAKYYWSVFNPAATFYEEYVVLHKKTTKPTYTVTVPNPYNEIRIDAMDKYNNLAQMRFSCYYVTQSIGIGRSAPFTSVEDFVTTRAAYMFIPTESGNFEVRTDGSVNGILKMYIYDSDSKCWNSTAGDGGANIALYGYMEKETVYYITLESSTANELTIAVTGPGSETPIVAINNGAKVTLNWAADPAAQKYNLYRREQGQEEWTTVAKDLTSAIYEDTASLLMGVTYEYTVKSYDGTAWSDFGPVASLLRNPFVDVLPIYGCFEAVAWAKNNGIVNGIDASHFGTSDPVQRQHFAIMLWRFAGQPKGSTTNPFADIGSCNATAKKAILWASGKGIIKGTKSGGKTYFKPTDYITREQILIMLQRFAGKAASNVTEEMIANLWVDCCDDFDALGCKESSVKAMAWAYDKGLLEGAVDEYGDGILSIRPKDYCDRSDLCIFLYNFNNNVKKYK